MISQMPSAFRSIPYYQGLSLILWIASIVLLFFAGILFLIKGHKSELKSQKMMQVGNALFAIFFGLTRILFIVAVYEEYAGRHNYDFYTTLGYITALIGLIFWMFVLERYMIRKTKMIFTIIAIVSFFIAMIALSGIIERRAAVTLIYAILPFSLVIILMLYIFLIVKTTGEIRKKAIYQLLAIVLMLIGHFMDSEFFITNFAFIPLEVAPSIMIAGVIVFIWKQML